MSAEHSKSMENVVTEEDQSFEFLYQIIQHTLQALSKIPPLMTKHWDASRNWLEHRA